MWLQHLFEFTIADANGVSPVAWLNNLKDRDVQRVEMFQCPTGLFVMVMVRKEDVK